MTILLSRGHGGKNDFDVGAQGLLSEVVENARVAKRVVELLQAYGVTASYFEEKQATTVARNLHNLVAWHNAQARQLDIQIHFNKVGGTTAIPIGVEVWHYGVRTAQMAEQMATAIAQASGLYNRGAKVSSQLYFLRHTTAKALLIEVCFVESRADVALYKQNFEAICKAIATTAMSLIDIPQTEASVAHKAAWQWAQAQGLMNGKNPQQAVTREQLASVLYRQAQKK